MSKKNLLIMLIFTYSYSFCQSNELLSLSSRIGDTITIESRDYFGLFPNIKEFSNAVLYQDNNSKYFKVKTETSEFDLPVSDSSILILTTVIDNFEDIISKKKLLYVNRALLTNLLSIYTRNNPSLKSIKLTLRDGTSNSGFIVLTDSNFVIMSKDSINRLTLKYLESFHYNDIYSISDLDYSIIDGCKEVFLDNEDSFLDVSYFTNPNGLKVAPPEVWNFLKEKSMYENNKYYQSQIDFDNLYIKRFMLSLDLSHQIFNLKGIPSNMINHIWTSENYAIIPFSINNYFTIGLNLDYNLINSLRIQFGYNYEMIDFNFRNYNYTSQLLSNTINMNIFYNFWKGRDYSFFQRQFFSDIFCGIQLHNYYYKKFQHERYYDKLFDPDIMNYDIVKELKYSYKIGINVRYKINQRDFLYISCFLNYHNDYGLIIYAKEYTTRYIHYILSYGINYGFGIEF